MCIFLVKHPDIFPKGLSLPTYKALSEAYRSTVTRTNALFENADDTMAAEQPSEHRWSMLDCIGHLTKIGEAYVDRIGRTLDKTADRGGHGIHGGHGPADEVRFSFIGRYMIRKMEPPPRLKIKSPRAYVPQSIGSIEETSGYFIALQHEMLRLLDRMAAQRTPRTWMSSPIIPAIILPLPDWFGLVVAHARRHLWQAEQAKHAVTEG